MAGDGTNRPNYTQVRHHPGPGEGQGEELAEFMAHCCTSRHYFFAIRKCGKVDCTICGPPTLPQEELQELKQFPDPVKEPDGSHYKPFSDIWGSVTTEKDRPSLSSRKSGSTSLEGVSFTAKAETVRAVIVCDECDKPRCLHAAKKLTDEQKHLVTALQQDYHYICGAPIVTPDSKLHGVVAVREG